MNVVTSLWSRRHTSGARAPMTIVHTCKSLEFLAPAVWHASCLRKSAAWGISTPRRGEE
jgi:hypothetical protein